MKFKLTTTRFFQRKQVLKLIMRTFIFLFCTAVFSLSPSDIFSQNSKIVIDTDQILTVDEVFDLIDKQTDYSFVYKSDMFMDYPSMDIKKGTVRTNKLLRQILSNGNFDVVVGPNNTIIIKEKQQVIKKEQNYDITGTVTDQNGQPLPGANIIEKGTSNGAQTDFDGKFVLSVSNQNAVLVVSYIGFVTKEIIVDSNNITVSLVEDAALLDQVVVVGYGSKKRVNLTGSVGILGSKDLEVRTITDARQALQGTINGISIVDRGGAPGQEEFDLKIRGIGTLGNSDPLILIDGIQRNIADLDSDDIESISVLKDAASSSIYGSRAANGVVLITTKRAKVGQKLSVEYDTYVGFQKASTLPKAVGAEDYLRMVNEASTNVGGNDIFTEQFIQSTIAGNDPDFGYVNWYEELFESGNGLIIDNSFRVSTAGEKTRNLFAANYLDQNGIMANANNKRYSLRWNSDTDISKNLKLTTDIWYLQKDVEAASGMEMAQEFANYNPQITPKYPNGIYGVNRNGGVGNPLAMLEVSGNRNQIIKNLTTRFQAEYEILEGLTFTGMFAYASDSFKEKTYDATYEFVFPNDPETVSGTWGPSRIEEVRSSLVEKTTRFLLNYNLESKNHKLGLLGGFEQIDNEIESVSATRQDIFSNDFPQLSLGDPNSSTNDSSISSWGLRSYFGRANYAYKDKYLVEANLRYDGSSRFAEGNKWGVFPSFSVGWKFSNESFLSDVNWLSSSKLRASWGELGNQNIGPYPFSASVASGQDYTFAGVLTPGYSQLAYANNDISWETTTMLNIGIDLSLFKGKLNLIADWYKKTSEDILFTLPIDPIVGLTASETNAGEVENTGWEIEIQHRNSIGDFKYGIGFLISDVKNEVTDLAGQSPIIDGALILKEGEAINSFYGYQTDGLFSSQAEIDAHPTQPNATTGLNLAPGDIKFVDRDGDGDIDEDDRYVMGANIPRYTMGLNLNMEYKNFDLTAFFQGAAKYDLFIESNPNEGPNFESFTSERWLDRWTPENPNPNASMPRLTYNSTVNSAFTNDFYQRDAKYVRLKNLQIGYNFPEEILDKLGIQKLRLFATGTNIFTLSPLNEEGFDPEMEALGRPIFYPPVSTYSLGLNLKF